ncbi:hypothetical protein BH09DEP1_BH09DEP1_4710 [soil metagenome]
MIKFLTPLVFLFSLGSFAMEMTQDEIIVTKKRMIDYQKNKLEEKMQRHERLLKYMFGGFSLAGVAAIATKLGYLSGERIGARGWSLISCGCGLMCMGGLSSIGKTQNEIKNLPNIITDDYVRASLNKTPKV